MKKLFYILLALTFVQTSVFADTGTGLLASEPVPQWQSTSSLLRSSSRGAARVTYAQPAQYRPTQSAAPVMNWKPLYTTSSRKRGTFNGGGGIPNFSGTCSAVTISRDNFSRSQQTNYGNSITPSKPRRVNGDDEDDPGETPDPFAGDAAPIGDAPWLIILLLGVGYIAFVSYRRRKTQKS